MRQHITVRRVPYEEPHHLELLISASNGRIAGEIRLYVNASDLIDIANVLEQFPRHATDVFLYEYGSERPEDRWAYYFRLRAFTTSGRGGCAIQIRLNNNQALPDREIAEFCLHAEASAVNDLGKKFRAFSRLDNDVLEWSPA